MHVSFLRLRKLHAAIKKRHRQLQGPKQAQKRDVRDGTTCDLDKNLPEWLCQTWALRLALAPRSPSFGREPCCVSLFLLQPPSRSACRLRMPPWRKRRSRSALSCPG